MKFERLRAWRPIAVIIAVAALIATLTTAVPTAAAPGDSHTYSGTVTATGGGALSGMTVSVFCTFSCPSGVDTDPSENPLRPWPVGGQLLGEDTTDGSGDWSVTVTEPASGSLFIVGWDPTGDRGLASPSVFGWSDQSGIGIELPDGGVLSGEIVPTDGSPTPAAMYDIFVPTVGYPAGHFGLLVEADGSYSTPGLPNDDYSISYRGMPAPYVERSNYPLGTIAGGADAEADHEILMPGTLMGRVTNGSGDGLGGILVSAFGGVSATFGGVVSGGGGGGSFQVFTNPDGTYDSGAVLPGDWTVQFLDPGGMYGSEFFDDARGFSDADAATVPSNGGVDDIDAELGLAGRIVGQVADKQGIPFDTTVVLCVDDGFDFRDCSIAFTEAGRYSFDGLAAGTYYMSATDAGWLTIYAGGGPEPGSPIVVTPGSTEEVDFEVAGGRIAGRVTNSSGDPVAGLQVNFAVPPPLFFGRSTQTAADGTYLSPVLAGSEFTVTFGSIEAYDDQPVGSGELVEVEDGETTSGIDAVLEIGMISGRVTTDGDPLPGVTVSVIGPSFANVTTGADGRYSAAVAPGDYQVSFNAPGYQFEYYDDTDFTGAETISVADTSDVTGVDADLDPLDPPTPPPSGVEIGGSNGAISGVPSFGGSRTIDIEADGCPGGSAFVTFSDGFGFFTTGLEEGPSGTFTTEVPAGSLGVGGRTDVVISIACPDGDDNETIEFNIYIDPAGTVVDQRGNPIEGATVTLMQDNPETIPVDFEVVPDGSAVMDPTINNTNPDTTGSDGAFRWDVVAGLWKVRAEAPNCHAPGDSSTSFVETEELIVPPPRLGLVLELECTPVCPSDGFEDPFTDVPDTSFASGPVSCIYELGVTTGTSATTYSPGNEVTREQMAAFLARLYEAITGSAAPVVTTPFTDLTEASSFAQDPIAQIYGLGITTGTSPTTYSPKDLVTRQQMAAFLARLFEAATGSAAPVVTTPFTDLGDASPFARDPIAQIYGLGVTTGTSATTYSPLPNVTRDQMAAFLARLYVAAY